MPRIIPALLSGLLAGLTMGLIAYTVVAASVAEDPGLGPAPITVTVQAAVLDAPAAAAPGETPDSPASTVATEGAEQTASLGAGEEHWLGQIVDAVKRFGPPASSDYFILAREGASTDDDANVFGVVAMRRLERTGALLLEREVVFSEGGVRVLHTERIEGDTRRLVWREFLPSGARTWMAEWEIDGDQVQTIAYGWNRPVHEWMEGAAGMVGPLELLDRMRAAEGPLTRIDGASLAMIDPSAASISEVGVRAVDSKEGTESTAVVRRTDGSLVMDAVLKTAAEDSLAKVAIASLRFGEGRIVAMPIREGEFHRRRGRWKVETVPAHEAVLARIPKRR